MPSAETLGAVFVLAAPRLGSGGEFGDRDKGSTVAVGRRPEVGMGHVLPPSESVGSPIVTIWLVPWWLVGCFRSGLTLRLHLRPEMLSLGGLDKARSPSGQRLGYGEAPHVLLSSTLL